MKNILLLLFFVLTEHDVVAQQNKMDSLKQILLSSKDDSIQFALCIQIGEWHCYKNNDTALFYIKKAISLANQKGNALWQAHARVAMLSYLFVVNDFVASLNLSLQNINDYSRYQDPFVLAYSIIFMNAIYLDNGYPEKAIADQQKVIDMLDTLRYANSLYRSHFFSSKETLLACAYENRIPYYRSLQKIDSALWLAQKAYEEDIKGLTIWNYPVHALADIYRVMGQADTALALYKIAASLAMKEFLLKDVADSYNSIAAVYNEQNEPDSAIRYARKAIALEKQTNYRVALDAALLISKMYETQHRDDSALYYFKYAMSTKDSSLSSTKVQQVQSFAFKEEIKEREQRQHLALQQT